MPVPRCRTSLLCQRRCQWLSILTNALTSAHWQRSALSPARPQLRASEAQAASAASAFFRPGLSLRDPVHVPVARLADVHCSNSRDGLWSTALSACACQCGTGTGSRIEGTCPLAPVPPDASSGPGVGTPPRERESAARLSKSLSDSPSLASPGHSVTVSVAERVPLAVSGRLPVTLAD